MKKYLTLENLFLLTIISTPLYSIRFSFFGVPTNILEIMIMITLVTWFSLKKGIIFRPQQHTSRLLLGATILLVLGLLLSIFSGNSFRIGFGIMKGWFIFPIFFSLALYDTFESISDIKNVIGSMYASAFVVSLISIGYEFSGLRTFDGRLSSFYLSPNHLAMYLTPGLLFGLYFLTNSILTKTTPKITSLMHLIAIFLIFHVLYMTHSYAAWLAAGMAVLSITFLKTSQKLRLFVILGVFISLGMFFLMQSGTEKFSSLIRLDERSSLSSRIMIWRASAHLISTHPVIGIGPGNFQDRYLDLQPLFPPFLEWAVPQPHNIFLAFWLQTGLLGLIGFILIFYMVIKELLYLFEEKNNTVLATSLLLYFAYIALHGLVDTTYWKNDLSFIFWICVALVFSFRYPPSKSEGITCEEV